ncbi:MAG: sugar ABC transporter ATP-binding protein [Hespellia sp.]|nr:sugar ABC transporter ATP-binding protein [Hespellia sp.]
MSKKIVYELEDISKSYPGVKVFEHLNLDVEEGEIHCLCGENGAGKSTLIKILSGAHAPNSGTIRFEGKRLTNLNPRQAMEMGVQTIYQEHNLFMDLSVTENMFCGNEIVKGSVIDRREMKRQAKAVLQILHSDIDPDETVSSLASGAQKMVEIARGLIQNAKVLILDEPTASFSKKEIEHLLACLKDLAAKGMSIVYISHHLEEVFEIADRITVIRDGQKICTKPKVEFTEQGLISEMVGRDVSMFYNRERTVIGEILFEAKDITGNGVKKCSITARAGEIVGIYGMVGSGRTEFAEVLFGEKKKEKGEIFIKGSKVQIKSPKDAIHRKMCFITEDRQGTGLFLNHALDKNIPIAKYTLQTGALALPAQDTKLALEYISSLGIVTPGVEQNVVNLSGGNQQKVVLAKWFATKGDIFIFDEPTRGVDIGAKEEIYKLMVKLLKAKKTIIMISSDMLELIAMSDRALVMRKGNLVATVEKEELREEVLLQYSIGGNEING